MRASRSAAPTRVRPPGRARRGQSVTRGVALRHTSLFRLHAVCPCMNHEPQRPSRRRRPVSNESVKGLCGRRRACIEIAISRHRYALHLLGCSRGRGVARRDRLLREHGGHEERVAARLELGLRQARAGPQRLAGRRGAERRLAEQHRELRARALVELRRVARQHVELVEVLGDGGGAGVLDGVADLRDQLLLLGGRLRRTEGPPLLCCWGRRSSTRASTSRRSTTTTTTTTTTRAMLPLCSAPVPQCRRRRLRRRRCRRRCPCRPPCDP